MKVRFDAFTLDTAARRLTCGSEDLHLSPKAFDLLALLLARRPAVLDKATLRATLWPGVHVVDASLSNLVTEIRAVLSPRSGAATLVRTVHGVGYAFAAEHARVIESPGAAEDPPPSCWVVWQERPFALVPGDNVIGRDAACAVWIDSDDVSRRHARIHVPPEGQGAAVTIEDLGSTNGTTVQGKAIGGITVLTNGHRIRLGRATLVFRCGPADAPTKRVGRAKSSD